MNILVYENEMFSLPAVFLFNNSTIQSDNNLEITGYELNGFDYRCNIKVAATDMR